MEDHDNVTKRKIRMIQELFSGEDVQEYSELHSSAEETKVPEINLPDQDLQDFLSEREQFRDKMHEELTIVNYLENYDTLCRYGLDEYFMELLKWEINIKQGNDPDNFFSPEFELRSKDHQELLDLAESLNKVQPK